MPRSIESLQREMAQHRKNLDRLEERKAMYGLNVPIDILNAIDQEKAEIARIEALLAGHEVPTSAPSPAVPPPSPMVVQGDVVYGDKVGGDAVGGHKVVIDGGVSGGDVSVGDTTVQGPVSGTGIAIGAGARATVSQGMSGDEVARLLTPLRQAIQQAELPSEQKQEAAAQAETVAAELSKPQPDGSFINGQLMKLVTVGGTVALAVTKLLQTPAIQALIQRAMGG